MRYAFILGRVYTLSVAELAAILEKPDKLLGLTGQPVKILDASEEVLIIETEEKLNVEKLQKRLGGVVKILEVLDFIKKREQDSVNFALKHYFRPSVLKKQFLKDYKGKMQFGLSIYLLDMALAKRPPAFDNHQGSKTRDPASARRSETGGGFAMNIFGEPKRLGMMIKKAMVDSGASIRLVLPEFNSLSLASVVVTKNLLLQKGAEICILAASTHIYTAKTLTVQDFEDYGRRDYQRPVRDEKQGMIPPKVAQIMLNLSGAKHGETVLDPFCGIGTIVQEGLLVDLRMVGSDINKAAIHGSEQNLEWFRNRYKIAPGKYGVEVCDATKVANLIEKSQRKIAAIVTEGTLGPLYGSFPKSTEIAENFKELTKLYSKSFTEFAKFLPKGGRVVLCVPAYRKNRESYEKLPSLDFIKLLGYNFVDIVPAVLAKKLKFLKLTERNTAIYDRKDQIVAREIVIFEKQ